MTQAVRFAGTAVAPGRAPDEIPVRAPDDALAPREKRVAQLRLLWNCRVFLLRMAFAGALLACAIAFVIPKRYESEAQLMPPDNRSGAGLAVAAALANQAGGMGGMAGDLLGLKSSGALFVGVLN
ncbi:MAG: Wzz/FepE/Etk N-terminal domain-containing protein, partial [Candidatus Acidiferrales bacterium]